MVNNKETWEMGDGKCEGQNTDPQLMHCPGGRDSCLALLCFSFVCPISLQFSCYFTKHFNSLSLMGLALTRCLHKCPSILWTIRTVT